MGRIPAAEGQHAHLWGNSFDLQVINTVNNPVEIHLCDALWINPVTAASAKFQRSRDSARPNRGVSPAVFHLTTGRFTPVIHNCGDLSARGIKIACGGPQIPIASLNYNCVSYQQCG